LSLAREILRAHGGDLSLEASDDQLTSFVVQLPAISFP
jgi:signal transduction histidine kinase